MDSTCLAEQQIAKLEAIVIRDLRFLGKLRSRMERLGFTPADPLYAATTNAFNGVHQLRVELHYLSCKSGVGR